VLPWIALLSICDASVWVFFASSSAVRFPTNRLRGCFVAEVDSACRIVASISEASPAKDMLSVFLGRLIAGAQTAKFCSSMKSCTSWKYLHGSLLAGTDFELSTSIWMY